VEDCEELKKLRSPTEEMALLSRVGSLGTIANLCVSLWMDNEEKSSSSVLLQEMKKGVIDTLSVHSAIIALDASRINIWNSNQQQSNDPFNDNKQLILPILNQSCNLTFQSPKDISPTSKRGYLQYWPVLSTFAVYHFMDRISKKDDDTSKTLTTWLYQIIPLLFLGFNESIESMTIGKVDAESSLEDNITFLLFGIRCFVTKRNLISCNEMYNDQLKSLVINIMFGFMLPALDVSKDVVSSFLGNVACNKVSSSISFSENLIHQSCGILVDIYSTCLPELVKLFGSMLLHVILIPLGVLQAGHFDLQSSSSATVEIVHSCITCVYHWIKAFPSQETDTSFLKSMIQLSLSIYVQIDNENIPIKVKDAVHDLFLECASNFTKVDKINIAQEAARIGSWELWKLLCIEVKEESMVSGSFQNIKIALSDVSKPNQHIPALAAISAIVQDASYNNIVFPLMHFVGVDILSLLTMYGLNMSGYGDNPIHRTTVCANATRLLMLAYQQLHSAVEAKSEEPEEKGDDDSSSMNPMDALSDYLKILFTIFASVIDYNGLPNAGKDNLGSDSALGRMCAQSIVHTVRTSPLAFKSSLIRVEDRERGVLETAVRADMTGYSTSSSNKPSLPKKKLNLKAFRK